MSKKELLSEIDKVFPELVFKQKKDHWLWRFVGFFSKNLLNNYTTIENTIWCPEGINRENIDYATLTHELIHLNQIWFGKFYATETKRAWYHRVLWYLKYLFWVFPIGYATFRAEKEIEAFLLQYLDENNSDEVITKVKIDRAIYFVTSAYYLYSVSENKAKKIVEKVIQDFNKFIEEDEDKDE